jgi:hypothetical protein
VHEAAEEFAWPQSSGELEHWRRAGIRPRLFLRDDDAIARTPQLDRLFGLCRAYSVPLLLAAIPAMADESLGNAVRAESLVTGAVHGYRHVSHAPPGSRPCELGVDRPVGDVIGELRTGRDKLASLFGARLSALVVPPWNRIHPQIAAEIGAAGFAGVSAHGWEPPGADVKTVNCHVDLIHWSGGRVGRPPEWLDGHIAANLAIARNRGHAPIGILAHHLNHDETAWRGLEMILQKFSPPAADWVAADTLLDPVPAATTQA